MFLKKLLLPSLLATSALLGSAALADDECVVELWGENVGPGKTYDMAEINAFYDRGYTVFIPADEQTLFSSTRLAVALGTTSRNGVVTEYAIQLGRYKGSSMLLSEPSRGRTIKEAIVGLPMCGVSL